MAAIIESLCSPRFIAGTQIATMQRAGVKARVFRPGAQPPVLF
jgi:hypothetical protein